MQIYDIVHMGKSEIKDASRGHFYKAAHIKDERVIDMLVEKGYIDLEDTLLQHKQKAQLMLILEGKTGTDQNHKLLYANATEDEQFARGLN